MPSEGFDKIQISRVTLQWKMPVQNPKKLIIMYCHICQYVCMCVTGDTLCGQQTSVMCDRFTEFV